MSIDLSNTDLAFALSSVTEASKLAQKIQADIGDQKLTKDDLSPVTVADFALQAVIARALRESFPDAILIGEEDSADFETSEGKTILSAVTRYVAEVVPGATESDVCEWIDVGQGEAGDVYWTLDPIDGTKGFLRRDQYAVALARVEQGVVTHGVLGCPNLEMFGQHGALVFAQRGAGCWHRAIDGEELTQLKVSPQDDVTQARLLRSFESGHTNVTKVDIICDELSITAEPVRMDSQAKYAIVASGGGELLFRMLSAKQPDYKEKIWDQAAGAIVVEEAGGTITDLYGEPLDFTQGRTLAKNTGVFASNTKLHAHGVAALNDKIQP